MQRKKIVVWPIILVIVTIISTLLTQFFLLDSVVMPKSLYEKYKKYDKLMALEENIEKDYYQSVKEEDLLLGAEKGMFAALKDPYSEYYTKEEYSLLIEQTEGEFVGIGVYIGADSEDNIVVAGLMKGYPAEKSGIKTGDIILKVDGKKVKASESSKAISMIKGEVGTSVNITIKRGQTEFDVNVKREQITVKSVYSKVIDGDIGYLQITSFDNNTYNEFKEELDKLQKKNVKSLVIDLRDNPGGLLNICVKIADHLLGEGTIVYTKDNNGNKEYFKSDKNKVDLPMAVLINKGSASASEILTGAIVDNKAGIAVGTTSYGKGLVQSVKGFKDGTGFKLTTSQYYTPSGDYINKKGIKPQIIENNPDKQLDKAVEYLNSQK